MMEKIERVCDHRIRPGQKPKEYPRAPYMLFNPNPELHHDNQHKHHLTLQEAELLFTDPYRIDEEYDLLHSDTEPRYYAIGILPSGKIIKANYTMRGDAYRLITAREATREKKKQYAEHLRDILGV